MSTTFQSELSVEMALSSDTDLLRDESELTANYDVTVSADLNTIFDGLSIGGVQVEQPSTDNLDGSEDATISSSDEEWFAALLVLKGEDDADGYGDWHGRYGEVPMNDVTLLARMMTLLSKLLYPNGSETVGDYSGTEGSGQGTPGQGFALDVDKVTNWINAVSASLTVEEALPDTADFGQQIFTVAHLKSFFNRISQAGRTFITQDANGDGVAYFDLEENDVLRLHVTLKDSDRQRSITFNFNLKHNADAPLWRSPATASADANDTGSFSYQSEVKYVEPVTYSTTSSDFNIDANTGIVTCNGSPGAATYNVSLTASAGTAPNIVSTTHVVDITVA